MVSRHGCSALSRRWIHQSRSRKIAGVSASLKYARQPRRYAPSSLVTCSMLRPPVRRVICRTRCFIPSRAFGATRRRTSPPLATRKL